MEHVGSQMTFEIGTPDPAVNGPVIDRVEQVYGVGQEAYRSRTAERDRRTRAILDALEDGPFPS
jgi:ketoreductase RED1